MMREKSQQELGSLNMKKNYIFIGDNLSIMAGASFQEFIGKVDLIYIDPPYNTKSSFSYNDSRDSEDRGVFMKRRLEVGKTMLCDGGIIFLSIDDNEYASLKMICDEIFGKHNFVGTFITQQSKRSNTKLINITHEYVICYAKNKNMVDKFKIKRINVPGEKEMIFKIIAKVKKIFNECGKKEALKILNQLIKKYCFEKDITRLKNYNCIDDNGDIFFGKDLSTPGKPRAVNIPEINLQLDPLPTRGWSSDAKFIELYKQNLLHFKGKRPYEIHYLKDAEDNISSVLNFYSRQGTNDLNKLGLRDLFDTPKPVELIKFLIRIGMSNSGICLDFFAGSGTTAQAVYELNWEDGGTRSYILIQLDELIKENSKVYEACQKKGILPVVSEVMIHRIQTFLYNNKKEDSNLSIN